VVVSLSPGIIPPGEGFAVELRSSKRHFSRSIEHISVSGSEAVVSFSGVGGIGEALPLVGCEAWADGPALKVPAEGALQVPAEGAPAAKEAPAGGLLGFQVFDLQGNCWGTVRSQPQFSLNQLLEVEEASSGELVFVPWHESLIVSIDPQSGTIVIDPPAGLRDLNK